MDLSEETRTGVKRTASDRLESQTDDNQEKQEKKLKEDRIFYCPLNLEEKIQTSFENGVTELKIVIKSNSSEKLNIRRNDFQSEFGNTLKESDEVIFTRNDNVIVLARSAASAINVLHKSSIKDREVICHAVEESFTSQYILKDVETSNTLEHLYASLVKQGITPNKIIRFNKRGSNEATPVIFIQELGKVTRSRIKINYISYNTKNFIQKPKVCYKCLHFGHFAKSCSAQSSKCFRCGGPHESTICPEEQLKCFRCSSKDHSALDTTCPIVKLESDKLNKKGRKEQPTREHNQTIAKNKLYSTALKTKNDSKFDLDEPFSREEIAQEKIYDLTRKIENLEKTVQVLTKTISDLCAKTIQNQLPQQSISPSSFEKLDNSIIQSIVTNVETPLTRVTESTQALTDALVKYIKESEKASSQQEDRTRERNLEREQVIINQKLDRIIKHLNLPGETEPESEKAREKPKTAEAPIRSPPISVIKKTMMIRRTPNQDNPISITYQN